MVIEPVLPRELKAETFRLVTANAPVPPIVTIPFNVRLSVVKEYPPRSRPPGFMVNEAKELDSDTSNVTEAPAIIVTVSLAAEPGYPLE
jgi:hypothetical protein